MNNHCEYIHKLCNNAKRYTFPFDINEIPKNGIYILFEKGEIAHSVDRIVRIGTHTGYNNLPKRLEEHFMRENKDRSIFRKNIGRAILNKNDKDFLKYWEFDLTTKDAKNKYLEIIDMEKQNKIESEVTNYIQDNFSFMVFGGITNRYIRKIVEEAIISTVSWCNECKPSENWLGTYSSVRKIKKSGLWLVQGLWKTPLDNADIKLLESTIG